MKIALLLTLFFPSLLLANPTTFCNAEGDKSVVTIQDSNFTMVVNGVVNTFNIKQTLTASGKEAQVDAHLIGEAIERSDVYELDTTDDEEIYIALVTGVSGNVHLIEVYTTTTLGTTAECKN